LRAGKVRRQVSERQGLQQFELSWLKEKNLKDKVSVIEFEVAGS
jgi:hypothetical protein